LDSNNRVCPKGSIIAVADTHLGLRERTTFKFFKNTVSCEPDHLLKFIHWIKRLEKEDKFVDIEARGNKKSQRKLIKPEFIVFLGDVIELWDANDRAVNICSISISRAISELKCKKIYLIGNHDYANQEIRGEYPFGGSNLEIFPDTFPEQKQEITELITVEKGGNDFIFTHGHLFNWTFRNLGKLAMAMSYIRDGAEAFGWYSWILFLGFIFIPLIMCTISIINIFRFEGSIICLTLIILGLLSIPRIITSIVRPIWNFFHKPRYNRECALNGFIGWWNRFSKDKKIKKVNVIYGHTHLLDILHHSKALRILRRVPKEEDILLVNLPAWVTDSAEERKDIFNEVFLYIDDKGFELFGWDHESEEPYHIPKWAVEKIGDKEKFKIKEFRAMKKLGLPSQFKIKLMKK